MTQQTHELKNRPRIVSYASMAGPMEAQGPMAKHFDRVFTDDRLGQDSFEQAECQMLIRTIHLALDKARKLPEAVSFLLAGDLLNQIISSSFAAREVKIPMLGLYGACSTMAEGLCLGAMLVNAGYGKLALAGTASHFSTAERQYRTPLEMGCQRPPTAQRTVTGAGATLIGTEGHGPCIPCVTLGRVIDLGISDPNQMGAAMAPAAADTLLTHFKETQRSPADYDLIVTGDLGTIGASILRELMAQAGYPLDNKLMDCGEEIFRGMPHVDAGGSGAGCSAVTLNGYLMHRLEEGKLRRVLFTATGALLSPTTTMQKESIPGIAHAAVIEQEAAWTT